MSQRPGKNCFRPFLFCCRAIRNNDIKSIRSDVIAFLGAIKQAFQASVGISDAAYAFGAGFSS
jgi:hypothetical protein